MPPDGSVCIPLSVPAGCVWAGRDEATHTTSSPIIVAILNIVQLFLAVRFNVHIIHVEAHQEARETHTRMRDLWLQLRNRKLTACHISPAARLIPAPFRRRATG